MAAWTYGVMVIVALLLSSWSTNGGPLGVAMDTGSEKRGGLASLCPLTVLFVEDNPDDVELSLRVLAQAEFEVRSDVVKTPEEFVHQVRTCYYDVVLADYNLGFWTGLDALDLMWDEGRDIPFILVTGALGDQRAIECIRKGITDYILKDRLDRLPVAIARAQEEKMLRNEQHRVQVALQENEAKFRALAEVIPMATFMEQGTHCRYANRAAERITGYSQEELQGMSFWQLILPESREGIFRRGPGLVDRDWSESRHEVKIRTKDNQTRRLDVTVRMFHLDGRLAALITAFDISERIGADGGTSPPDGKRAAKRATRFQLS